MSSIDFAEQFIHLVSALDPEGLAEAISHLPGGSSAAVALSSDVLLAQADSRMSGGHLVVDSTSEPRPNGAAWTLETRTATLLTMMMNLGRICSRCTEIQTSLVGQSCRVRR